jgi:glycosyltransferase involved in cell wall biosynthesis
MEADLQSFLARTLVLIPAYNEEASLPGLLAEVRAHLPGAAVAVVDDGSADATAEVARAAGARVLRLPCNLGVGPAVQTGFRYALESGYDWLIRLDGDGQHPPAEARKLVAAMQAHPTDLVVGTRYGDGSTYHGNGLRRSCSRAWPCSCRSSAASASRIPPRASGWCRGRCCAASRCIIPSDYPEAEAIALLRRQGFSLEEVPVAFKPRQAGESSIRAWGTV